MPDFSQNLGKEMLSFSLPVISFQAVSVHVPDVFECTVIQDVIAFE